MADNFDYINPYSSYEIAPQPQADGVRGNSLLDRVQSLQVGFGSQVLRIDRDGLWMGAEQFASAPFSVDMEGNMTATSLDLSDYLQVGDSLDDIQALIGDISDIDSDLGTIVAGNLIGVTVTGGTVQTSSSGSRILMDGVSDSLKVYSGSTKRMELDADELRFYDSGGMLASTIHANGQALDVDVGQYGYLSVNFDNDGSPSGFQVIDTDTSRVVFFVGGLLGSNTVQVGESAANVNMSIYGNLMVDNSLTVGNDLDVADNITMHPGGYIEGFTRLLWSGSPANPTGDGTMLYYDSGGSEGLRMQFGGSDFQFDASGV